MGNNSTVDMLTVAIDAGIKNKTLDIRGEVVFATMQDIHDVLMMIENKGNLSEYGQEIYNLREKYLHCRTVEGEFQFDSHRRGAWTIEMIKKYKKAPIKSEYHFVVEM